MKKPKKFKMEKAKHYVGLLIVGTVATLLGLKAYEMLNKPKVAAPATAPAPAAE